MIFIKDNTLIREQGKIQAQTKTQELFLASITHDLRTPLNSTIAFNQVLQELVKNNKPAVDLLKTQNASC